MNEDFLRDDSVGTKGEKILSIFAGLSKLEIMHLIIQNLG